jgi:TetR/AcrR family transcriptional repressor of nem operon
MRYPDGHKEAVRERIVGAASEALRRHGVAGVSIPALMKQAGLTHGGFYSHFEDRDELVAAAVRAAGDATAETTLADDLTLQQSVARYLSEPHLEHPEQGCVLAALGPDGPRQSPVVRRAFGEVARGFVAILDRKLKPGSKAKQLSDEALLHAATMIGAVVLGRLLDDATAKRLLAVARTSTTQST